MTEDQKAMRELLEGWCLDHGMTLVSLLSRYRRVDEPMGVLVERVYLLIEKSQEKSAR